MAAWAIDRLGRSLPGLVQTLDELREVGCGLYLHQQAIDTTTASGRAFLGMTAVFAEWTAPGIVSTSGLCSAARSGCRRLATRRAVG